MPAVFDPGSRELHSSGTSRQRAKFRNVKVHNRHIGYNANKPFFGGTFEQSTKQNEAKLGGLVNEDSCNSSTERKQSKK